MQINSDMARPYKPRFYKPTSVSTWPMF